MLSPGTIRSMGRLKLRTLLVVAASIAAVASTAAAESIGTVVAIRGKAVIERGGDRLNASVSTAIEAKDVIGTAPGARLKLKFADDSVLTMGEKSRLSIKEFYYSKEKGGRSIFNLIDGKLHSVVGKTKFEVETPTAVAAARGTVIYFEVGDVEELQ